MQLVGFVAKMHDLGQIAFSVREKFSSPGVHRTFIIFVSRKFKVNISIFRDTFLQLSLRNKILQIS